LRLAVPALFASASIAQEDAPVRFDPRETGSLDLDWSGYLIGTAIALAFLGAWWWLAASIERHRLRIPWKALRRVYPTAAVLVGIAIRFAGPHMPEETLALILIPYVLLGLPGVIGAGVFVAFREDAANNLLTGVIMCVTAWLFCYGAVRFLEWRALLNVPVSLDLQALDPAPRRHPPE
jgi:hypothetical protein